MDHNLYALDPHDGSLSGRWTWGAVIYSPTVDEEGTLYVATLGNEVIAVNPEAGSVKWRVQLEHSLWTQPALAEGSLYLGDLDGNVYALSAADGAQRWSQDLGEVSVIGRPTVSGSSVVFATQKNGLFAMTFDGARQWVYPGVNGTLYNGPITSEDRLVVGVVGGDNLLVALEPSGALAWTFTRSKRRYYVGRSHHQPLINVLLFIYNLDRANLARHHSVHDLDPPDHPSDGRDQGQSGGAGRTTIRKIQEKYKATEKSWRRNSASTAGHQSFASCLPTLINSRSSSACTMIILSWLTRRLNCST